MATITAVKKDISDLFSFEGVNITTKADPLAASCEAYLNWSKESKEWPITQINPYLQEEISDEAVSMANAVRKHFLDKFLLRKLLKTNGQDISKFSTDTYNFLLTTGNEVSTSQIGLLTKLPYFYHEDIQMESILSDVPLDNKDSLMSAWENDVQTNGVISLLPVGKVFKVQKSGPRWDYWFGHKSVPGRKYFLSVDAKNPIKDLMDREFDKPEISVSADVNLSVIRGFPNRYAFNIKKLKIN